MTSVQLEELLKEILRSYWRQRIAVRLFKLSTIQHSSVQTIEYIGIPELGFATGFLSQEATQAALDSVEKNLNERLPQDLFIALLAKFESFLAQALVLQGSTVSGPLGVLQTAVQNHYSVPSSVIDRLDEVRERRNILIHHDGRINAKYSAAAQKVIFQPWVEDPTSLSIIAISPEYLTYVVDTIVTYARHVTP